MLETDGTQQWRWDREKCLARLEDAYGAQAAGDIAAALT